MTRVSVFTSHDHEQTVLSDSWTVQHGLGFKPVVSVNVDYEGVRQAILPMDIRHTDDNTVVISFSQPFTGSARFV